MSEHQASVDSTAQTTTSMSVDTAVNEDAPIGFFAIGIVINLVLLAAYFIWAWRRWKQPDSSE